MEYFERDLQHTRRVLELAAAGTGLVSPNPLVGCVITDANGEAAGEGTYTYDNVVHAEVIALEQAGERARGGTAYISLEPHVHHGRTPPCTEALINAGIVRVVCPIEDPNPLVSGKGFERLREAGVEIVTGILSAEAATLNEKFICWHTKDRPFVHLKMAMSLDGRITRVAGEPYAFTGDEANQRIQRLRHEYDAILVGSNTAHIDDPLLTDRSGLPRRRPLKRVVLDSDLSIAVDSRLVNTAVETPTIIFTAAKDGAKADEMRAAEVEVLELESGPRDLAAVLARLKDDDIQSALVEGGAEIAASFFAAQLIDKVSFFYSPQITGGMEGVTAIGGSVPLGIKLENVEMTIHGRDIELTGYPQYE
ncbi:MAG: bifunctional diaminohydroxyphosphoribosylaminopyrimidine deaminase/5-amino-6-(5-phosphoribosylamino)uracil reductase RibD [Acidobacteriota bacterium]|nr:MAG: bifunctional diaminohydroxyphosphoribosylaminopyrimidine deaminase/5-amino-6-(5-phosphoribosylamino)uracil reductase RibD [Acidobacteriota bacterium]